MNPQLVLEQESPAESSILSARNVLEAVPGPQRQLFSQSFLEVSGPERRRRRASAMFSLTVQLLILAGLVLLPFFFLEALPMQQLATFLVAPPPPPPPPPPAPVVKTTQVVSEIVNGQLLTPSKIPQKIKMVKEEEAPPPMESGVLGGVVGGVPGGQAGGVLGSIIAPVHMAAPTVAVPKRLKISSGISEGLLMRRIEPEYPMLAQRAHVEGTVQLRAMISKDGMIENLQTISGHPFLVPAAIDAVKQWRYRPYLLNGEPLEIETIVIVNFHLHG